MTRKYYMREGQTRAAPFSLRLTLNERAALERCAGNMPLASYIKSVLFAEDAPKYRARRKGPVENAKALAEVLACLGSTRIANNLNQLAHAANVGNLLFDDETKRDLDRACDDIRVMRLLLMTALGMKVPDTPSPESTSQGFTRAAFRFESQA